MCNIKPCVSDRGHTLIPGVILVISSTKPWNGDWPEANVKPKRSESNFGKSCELDASRSSMKYSFLIVVFLRTYSNTGRGASLTLLPCGFGAGMLWACCDTMTDGGCQSGGGNRRPCTAVPPSPLTSTLFQLKHCHKAGIQQPRASGPQHVGDGEEVRSAAKANSPGGVSRPVLKPR